uniref:Uncharacterized protein n=1 Tax=Ailuropoda melanoleuca TaxID=9646 RepID=A0A7N5JXI5_AILME
MLVTGPTLPVLGARVKVCSNANTGYHLKWADDKLLVKEVTKCEASLPCTCQVHFPDPNKLHSFQLTVTPMRVTTVGEGHFQFENTVPTVHNMVPPSEICLSLPRDHSTDCTSWTSIGTFKDSLSPFGDSD